MSKLRVCILFGGKSGKSIYPALDKSKYDVVSVGVDTQGRWRMGEAAQRKLIRSFDTI